MIVPTRVHYDLSYMGRERWFSYAHQLAAVCELKPRTVLEIGVGAGIVSQALRTVGVSVQTLDIEPSNSPQVVASVLEMPFVAGAFDVALCCQVLEHLPFERFEDALRELRRVSGSLVLSLPDVDRYVGLDLRLPALGRVQMGGSLPRLRPAPIPPQRQTEIGHYWEIGFRGSSLRDVNRVIRRSTWRIGRTWRLMDMPWHRFFLLR